LKSLDTVSSGGPEKPTLIERLVTAFPLPYAAASLAIAVLIGPPLQLLAAYFDTKSIGLALKYTINTPPNSAVAGTVSSLQGTINQTIWFSTIFLTIYLIRLMRSRIVEFEPKLVPVLPLGEETFHRAFGGVSKRIPQVLIGVPFFLLSIPYILQPTINIGWVSLLFQLLSNGVVGIMFGSFIWVYFRSLWGIYRLGNEPLKLKSHYEDHMLGVRPIGSISLTLFAAYSSVIVLGSIALLLSPDLLGTVALIVMVVFGVAMFFIPLNSVHKTMVEQKLSQMVKVQQEFIRLTNSAAEQIPDRAEKILGQLRDTQILQINRDYVSRLPTWPSDTPILGKFAAIALSVAAILISKIISLPFRI